MLARRIPRRSFRSTKRPADHISRRRSVRMNKASGIVRLDADADTVHWGYFDARLPPVLTIDSGERVTISTVSGSPDLMPPPPAEVPPALPAIHKKNGPQRFFGHMCTGPVAVRG